MSININSINKFWQEIQYLQGQQQIRALFFQKYFIHQKNNMHLSRHLFGNISVIRKINETSCLGVSEANELAFTTRLLILFHENSVLVPIHNFFKYLF